MKRLIITLLILLLSFSVFAEESVLFHGYYDKAGTDSRVLQVVPSVVTSGLGDAGREKIDCAAFTSRREIFTWSLKGGEASVARLKFVSSALKHSENSSSLIPYTMEVTVERPYFTQWFSWQMDAFTEGYFQKYVSRRYYRDYVTNDNGVTQSTLNGDVCYQKKLTMATTSAISLSFNLCRSAGSDVNGQYSLISNNIERRGRIYVTLDDYSSAEPGYYSANITVILEGA